MHIRQATESDIGTIAGFDHIARTDPARREFIAQSVRSGSAWVTMCREDVVGYAVIEYTFFSQGFIAMLYVHREHRRQGIGSALVRRLETLCRTAKLFTSTNESNKPMQALLGKLGYARSGVIENLDAGDPEQVFVKRLQNDAGRGGTAATAPLH